MGPRHRGEVPGGPREFYWGKEGHRGRELLGLLRGIVGDPTAVCTECGEQGWATFEESRVLEESPGDSEGSLRAGMCCQQQGERTWVVDLWLPLPRWFQLSGHSSQSPRTTLLLPC